MPKILVCTSELVDNVVLEQWRNKIVAQNPSLSKPFNRDLALIRRATCPAIPIICSILKAVYDHTGCDRWLASDDTGLQPVSKYAPRRHREIQHNILLSCFFPVPIQTPKKVFGVVNEEGG